MPLGSQIAPHLPFLRRYARALTGDQARGDRLVAATLEAALANTAMREALRKGGRVALYQAFTEVFEQSHRPMGAVPAGGHGLAAADRRLDHVTPLDRQALLLTTLEEFTAREAAQIMGASAEAVIAAAEAALTDIAGDTATSVLIIEDEPLIAMQLETLVEGLGHSVLGTAATRAQAQALVGAQRPGLVLADIQLADGSSGLDALDDVLALADVPAIVITAFPERLLTGESREPTFLITKPFREDSVRAAIAQALFFHAPVAA